MVSEIKEGEADYNPITEEINLHPITDPAVREAAKTVGYYAMFELMNGFKKQLYSPIEAIQSHAKQYSRSYRYDLDNNKRSSVWSTNFDAMAKKTMIRQLIGKWGIMSVEMQQAYVNDMGVIDEDGTVRYADNPRSAVIENQVKEDISANANAVEFDEDVVDVQPVTNDTAKAPEEPIPDTEQAKPKATKAKTAKKPVKEPEPEYIDAEEDMPEWES